ncbi:MAG: OmpH family outer membrane protein [Marinicaulis sp.]|nr:OmpH family outer membrane protein [Marinicaulis sp.]NNE40027.1 OmpH family outer membrane protein [Marinicaulis sp.]NNL88868.1 OmpH family outer membrane protein [Marinicaulis sp.]
MRNRFLAVAGIVALTVVGVVGASLNGAIAQGAQKPPVILVVSRDILVAQSKAGKTIPDQAEKVRDSVSKELEAEAKKLQDDIEKYQKNASLMSDEVRASTEKELAVRQQYGLPQRVQIMEQAFQMAVQNAQTKILIESQPILKDIVDKRGATVLLDRAAVMYASPDADITQEVLAELDKKMKDVEVQKISLSEIEKQLKEAQAEQAAAQKK